MHSIARFSQKLGVTKQVLLRRDDVLRRRVDSFRYSVREIRPVSSEGGALIYRAVGRKRIAMIS